MWSNSRQSIQRKESCIHRLISLRDQLSTPLVNPEDEHDDLVGVAIVGAP